MSTNEHEVSSSAGNAFEFPWKSFAAESGIESVGTISTNYSGTIPKLFSPLEIRGVRLKNRIVVSPMCQYSSKDGFMNDWHLVHLGAFAKGGAALVFTEASSVQENGRITAFCAGIWREEHVPPMARVVSFVHAHGALAGVQLAHAGRKASTPVPFLTPGSSQSTAWEPVGPSAISWGPNFAVPHELTRDEIQQIVTDFALAAKRARRAGFDVIEIHAAHGYLLHSFYSPLSNTRTDDYGGSFEGRIRLCVEVAQAVRGVWDGPLFVRLSCSDWVVPGGWDIEQTVLLARALKEVGVDVIDCSSGGNSPLQRVRDEPGYQVPFSERVRETGATIATAAVGRITEPEQAEKILRDGQADLILMAREFLREPYWPLKCARHFDLPVHCPPQYQRAFQ